jgi:signal transduction histidine kinase
MGLLGMDERAQRLGGRLEIESAPGSGTRICVHLPLDSLAEEEKGAQ